MFELILALLIFIPIGWVLYLFTGHMFNNIKEINDRKLEPIKVPEKRMIISERIGCLGYYMDKEVPSQVKLDTGELFEYENISKVIRGGCYIVPDPEVMRIRIDNDLIYKLVSSETNK
jgi:hypothetical protein